MNILGQIAATSFINRKRDKNEIISQQFMVTRLLPKTVETPELPKFLIKLICLSY